MPVRQTSLYRAWERCPAANRAVRARKNTACGAPAVAARMVGKSFAPGRGSYEGQSCNLVDGDMPLPERRPAANRDRTGSKEHR